MEKKKSKSIPASQKTQKPTKKNSFNELLAKKWFVPLLLFAAALIVYANSFGVPFQFDDFNQISYRNASHSFDFYKKLSSWTNVNSRAFSFLTITLNYVLHGEKVFGYHLVNFCIHFFSGLTLFYWLRMLPAIKNDESMNGWFPLVVSLFFIVHPVQIQSVTYIIQRMASLAGLFTILSAYLYTKGRLEHIRKDGFGAGIVFYLLALLTGFLGVLSKQNAVVFPVLLLMIEFFFIRDKEGRLFKKYLILAVGLMAVVVAGFLIVAGLPSETQAITRMQYLAIQMQVIPRYFQMMLFPVGLSIDHGVRFVNGFGNLWTLLGTLFLLLILAFAFLNIRKEPLVSFGILWIFVTLFIESSIFPITDPMFEQRMYLPLVGFGIAFWRLLDKYLFRRKIGSLKPVAVSILLLLSVMAVARNHVWNSKAAIWEDVTAQYPDYARGWIALGKIYLDDEYEDIPKSINCLERAVALDPENEDIIVDLGIAYLSNRQEEKAISCYSKLVDSEEAETRLQAYRVLAAYNAKKDVDVSSRYFRLIIDENPESDDAWESLMNLYFENKLYDRARSAAEEWLQKYPQNANAAYSVGKSLFYLNNKSESERYLKKAVELNPQHAESMMLYANILVNRFEFDEAIAQLEKAYAINKNSSIPKNIELIKNLKAKAPKPR